MVSHFRNYENVKLSHFDVFGNSQKVEVSTIHEHDLFSSFRFHPCLDPIDIDNHRDSAHQPAGQFEEERIVAAGGDERQPERATVERPQRQ